MFIPFTLKVFTMKVVIAGIVLLLLSVATAAKGELKIGTEGAYPPFNLLNEKGEVVGFDMDIAQALCAKMGVTCKVVTSDWDGIIPALNAKKFDFLIAGMSITPERKSAVDFTEPYCTNKLQFIAQKAMALATDKKSLKGKVIGAQRATIAGDWLAENLGDSVDITLYDTQENAYLDLASGRIDAVLADQIVSLEWLKSDAGKGFEFKGAPVFENDKIGIAVRKGDPLRDKLNTALAEIIKDGTYQTINEKYFPFSVY